MMKQDFSVQDEDAESARKASVEEKKRQEAASEIKVRLEYFLLYFEKL